MNRTLWAGTILLIFHTVGIIGLTIPASTTLFAYLSPLNLLLTFAVFTWANEDFSISYAMAFLLVGLIGFWVEVIGVETGLLFGEYHYGDVLGPSFLGVPLIIGVNWFLLSIISFGVSSSLTSNKAIKPVLAALLVTILDFFIEPVAIHLGYWTWSETTVPVQNYIMWFIVALVIQIILQKMTRKPKAPISFITYGVHLFFFIQLNILI